MPARNLLLGELQALPGAETLRTPGGRSSPQTPRFSHCPSRPRSLQEDMAQQKSRLEPPTLESCQCSGSCLLQDG
ncbi:hypothetical protein VULLAG_LOCUS5863 [Vulpes lagopus]